MTTARLVNRWLDGTTASHRWLLVRLGLLIGALLLGPGPALAGSSDVIGADEALGRAETGEVLLIDVRSPQEWRQTGVPKGARQVTIHDPKGLAGFISAVKVEVGGDLDLPIAVICAQGNRSTFAQKALTEAGFTNVLNIREGMLGSPSGPGWLSRRLPVDDCTRC